MGRDDARCQHASAAILNVQSLAKHAPTEAPREKISKQNFLMQLPQQVIRNGKVIQVRSEIASRMNGDDDKDHHVHMLETPVVDQLIAPRTRSKSISPPSVKEVTDKPHSSSELSAPSMLVNARQGLGMNVPGASEISGGTKITTLQVKSEDGKQTFILKLRFTDSISSVRDYIDKHRGPPKVPYEIRSPFPACTYTDEDETLEAAALVPNATLVLRARERT